MTYYSDATVQLHHGDCLDVLRTLPNASVDAVVTDPPAGIAFMAREWDDFRRARNLADAGREDVFGRTSRTGPEYGRGARGNFVAWLTEVMREALRVTKPGGHAFVWAIPRTSHWTALAIEDAGWEIRDRVAHHFGSGFPKSHNLTGEWAGWGTALKPATEDWWLARKPLAGTVAQNVLTHGTGALNIDACRVGTDAITSSGWTGMDARRHAHGTRPVDYGGGTREPTQHTGRWPANVVLDRWDEPVLRLRYNLPTEVERTIREAFGADTSHLPAVRDDDHRAPESSSATEVLLAPVPSGVDGREPDWREGAALRAPAHAGVDREDASERPLHERPGQPDLEGRNVPQSGLRDGASDGPAAGGADAVRADADRLDPRGVPGRAPASSGSDAGTSAAPGRARTPHQRREGRQPAGEPRGSLGLGSQADARRGGARAVPTASGERRPAASPVEVLRRECPPAWWQHFDVVGYRTEGQAAALDEQSGETVSKSGGMSGTVSRGGIMNNTGEKRTDERGGHDDTGGASRFFAVFPHDEEGATWTPTTNAEKSSPEPGTRDSTTPKSAESAPTIPIAERFFYVAKADASERVRVDGTAHPTVKPLALMRWLVRLVTPPGGTVLEPFAGSGTTVEACILEGFRCIAIEREADYLPLIMQRIHRRRDPVQAVRGAGEDGGLFDLLDGGAA